MGRQINSKSQDETHNWLTLKKGGLQITASNSGVVTVKFPSRAAFKKLPLFRLFRRLVLAGLLVLAGTSGCNTTPVKKVTSILLGPANNQAAGTGTHITRPIGVTIPTLKVNNFENEF